MAKTYAALPAHLRTLPEPLSAKSPGDPEALDLSLADSAKAIGFRTRVEAVAAADAGTLPSITGAHLRNLVPLLPTSLKDRIYTCSDPAKWQPPAAPLNAHGAVPTPKGVKFVPTRVSMPSIVTAAQREQAGRDACAAISEAIAAHRFKATGPIRLAWMTEDQQVRFVEYRSLATGDSVTPSKAEDLESQVAAMSLQPEVTLADLRNQVAAHIPAKAAAQAPAQAPAKVAETPAATVVPAAAATQPAAPIAAPVEQAIPAPAPAPAQGQASVFPARAARSTKSAKAPEKSLEERMAATRVFGDTAPTAQSGHVLVIKADSNDFNKLISEGSARIHAGMVSTFKPMLAREDGGYMGPGSQVLFAVRDGNSFTVIARAPYPGLVEGTKPAAVIAVPSASIRTDVPKVTIGMADVGMGRPNQPIVISKDMTVSGFEAPAEARRKVWEIIHDGFGWPGVERTPEQLKAWRVDQAKAGLPLGDHLAELAKSAYISADPDSGKPSRERLNQVLAEVGLSLTKGGDGALAVVVERSGESVPAHKVFGPEQFDHIEKIARTAPTAQQGPQVVKR